jgi:hypothetical protein
MKMYSIQRVPRLLEVLGRFCMLLRLRLRFQNSKIVSMDIFVVLRMNDIAMLLSRHLG